jgi:hypothetical protein
MLEDTEDMKAALQTDLKRLRREHIANMTDLEQISVKLGLQTEQLKNVVERQGLNDQAMAAIFKIMKLDHSLLAQDEVDKNSVFLMGANARTDSKPADQTDQARASTRVPIETSLDRDNQFKPNTVIALNKNCLTHSEANHNDVIIKAFKMACLNYAPSSVEFEHNLYARRDLIKAKSDLLQYCLSQLKHLDLSLLDHQMHVANLNAKTLE